MPFVFHTCCHTPHRKISKICDFVQNRSFSSHFQEPFVPSYCIFIAKPLWFYADQVMYKQKTCNYALCVLYFLSQASRKSSKICDFVQNRPFSAIFRSDFFLPIVFLLSVKHLWFYANQVMYKQKTCNYALCVQYFLSQASRKS